MSVSPASMAAVPMAEVRVRYGIHVAVLGRYAEPGLVVELAQAAEAAGWEALFVWDHLAWTWDAPSADPWVVLAAAAQATDRLRLGPAVTPLPRRRPAVVASAVATLDRLSGGRVIFGAGAGGVAAEFTAFGEPAAARDRAVMLDEGLTVLSALWSGQPVHHAGRFYRVDGVTLAPLPLQRPRVPVWIGGHGAAALRRAARWDGWVLGCDDEAGNMVVPPARIAAGAAAMARHDPSAAHRDIAVTGASAGPGDPVARAYAAAGATWWLEHIHGRRGSGARMLERVSAGPPA
jgi:alkanesulfonate monooxygenase SsuD/methylene tetrahydromethanopterin reductase-like flavin-dependent oxidoreductase (luciferase family)